LQGLRLAEEDDPGARAGYVRDLADLEGLLKEAGRVLDVLEQGRAARGNSGQPLSSDEKERIKDLEKTLKDLDKALKKMKGDKLPPGLAKKVPGYDKKPPGHEKGKEHK